VKASSSQGWEIVEAASFMAFHLFGVSEAANQFAQFISSSVESRLFQPIHIGQLRLTLSSFLLLTSGLSLHRPHNRVYAP
jgi:hypothetical protein